MKYNQKPTHHLFYFISLSTLSTPIFLYLFIFSLNESFSNIIFFSKERVKRKRVIGVEKGREKKIFI
jgi:hypothetical protein